MMWCLLLVPFMHAAEKPAFLSGKVHDLSGQSLSLDKKIEAASAEFQKAGGGKRYFTAYEFMSRHKIHRGSYRIGEGYLVNAKESNIKIEEISRGKYTVSADTEMTDSPSPAGLLFLHNAAKNGEIMDITLLDPDQTYDFAETPVFWLGRAGNEESIPLLEKRFEAGKNDAQLQKSLIFAISCHQGPEAYAFLKKAADGPYDKKIRESAIFWLGNYSDAKSLDLLREIYRKEQDDGIKKQIIFALQLSKQKEAVEELIRIAKQDPSQEARKQAVFWLGQKASAESIKALKDIIEEPNEESKLKDQAVFAVSQLPKDKSVPMLIDIAKTNKSASLRKKAIFWLGQSGDPAALRFFEDILLKK